MPTPDTRHQTLLTLLLLLLAVTVSAQERPVVRGELGTRLDEYMSRLAIYGMSGTILVEKGGEVVLHKAYGPLDRVSRAPITVETPFMIGSLAKQFTAAAILKLEMQGKLSTGDSLARFYPDAPADKRSITIHQLLTHTAGLPYLEGAGLFERIPRDEMMRSILHLTLDTIPGAVHAYSNPGYTLLAGVVEKASGETFESYLEREIFRPAGMTQTGFIGDSIRWKDARLHSYSGSNDEGSLADFPWGSGMTGSGSIISTAGDLHRWELALRTNSVLSKEATTKFFAPHVPIGKGASYGYGWNVIRTIRNTTLVTHAGDLGGYNTDMRRYVDEDLVVIFTSNVRVNGRGYREAVMNNVSLLISGAPYATPPAVTRIDPSRLKRYEGSYRLPSGERLDLWFQDGRPMISAEGQEGVTLLAGGDSTTAAEQQLTDHALRVVTATSRGDFGELRSVLHPSLTIDGVRQVITEEWRALRDSLGELKGVDPLGTAILSPMMARSYYRLRFERGSVVGMYGWVGGKITALEGNLDRSMTSLLAPESETTLASYDPFTGRSVRVEFELDKRGRATAMTIAGKRGMRL